MRTVKLIVHETIKATAQLKYLHSIAFVRNYHIDYKVNHFIHALERSKKFGRSFFLF